MGFTFDRLGVRVPAVVVSAYTRAGTVIHDEMHHASVIATLCAQHGLAPLTARDAGATPIHNALTSDTPRQPSTWPMACSTDRSAPSLASAATSPGPSLTAGVSSRPGPGST